jgi:hypothetical protein
MDGRLRIVVTGLIAQHASLGGMTWHHLQYVLGFERLGHEVFYVEDSGEWPYEDGSVVPGRGPNCLPNLRHLAAVMARYGLADRWAFRCPVDRRWSGLPDQRRSAVLRSADLLVDVSGSLERPWEYRQGPVLVYVDTDPVFAQIKLARGDPVFRTLVDAHDLHLTFGERLPADLIATGHDWRPTRQPIVLAEWTGNRPAGDAYTTVMSWSSYASEVFRGRRYGQKDVELRRFLSLPGAVRPAALELAIDLRPPWTGSPARPDPDRDGAAAVLAAHGWRLADPTRTSRTPDAYRDYVVGSRGEWTVAKNGYVEGRSGWFSERSACYLAAGRPVIAQDTGFSDVLPVGEGLLAFTSFADAVEAVAVVESDHARHARAARAVAEECFDSARVLTRLVDTASSVRTR